MQKLKKCDDYEYDNVQYTSTVLFIIRYCRTILLWLILWMKVMLFNTIAKGQYSLLYAQAICNNTVYLCK